MTVDLAIVIVTYNSEHMIGTLLDSLPASLEGLSAEVVVVDNGSVDGTVRLLEERGDCRVIRSTNRGYAGGVNVGIASIPEAPAVLVLNPDTVVHARALPPLLGALANSSVGIVAPRILSADGSLYFSLRREPTLRRALGLNVTKLAMFAEYVNQPSRYSQPGVFDWALGAALLLSRRCISCTGEWDESFFLYSEETDYCLRARDEGLVTYFEPRAVITHIGAQSGQSDATHAMQIINRVRLYGRRHSAVAAWSYYWLTVASEISWALRGHRQSRFSVRALLRPSIRPHQLGCSSALLPR